MNILKNMTFLLIAVFALHGCGKTSTVGGSGTGEEAVNSASILLPGLHYNAHRSKLENIFQLEEGDEAFDILEDHRGLFEAQDLTSSYMNGAIKVYAKACEEVSYDVIPMDASFEDVYFLMTGLVAGTDEQQTASEIEALLGSESDDYVAFGNCLVAATSLFSISQLSGLSL